MGILYEDKSATDMIDFQKALILDYKWNKCMSKVGRSLVG